jgi:hypothetical protein
MTNIKQTRIITYQLAETFPELWKEIQDIQREEQELSDKRTVERATAILKDRLKVLADITEEVDYEQLSIEFMF